MLQIFNTLSKTKEPFSPINSEHVGIYVCGMTVYDFCHMGHARVLVMFDIITRHLRRQFPKVTYVRNITDIDDKIIKRAIENGESIDQLTNRFIEAMHEDEKALGILPPDIEPRATESMNEIFYMIETLVEKRIAYQGKSGDVYYSVRKFPNYGKLSGKNLDDLEAGARVDVEDDKDDPLDFVLWKMAKPEEPSWESPWGDGRPGWHIECSAMSSNHLGNHFDIHGGGMDLKFPHHECELAQARALGHDYARYWLHANLLTINGQKMAKSLGNFITLEDAFQTYDPLVLRYFIVAGHYGSVLDFSDSALQGAETSLQRLQQTVRTLQRKVPTDFSAPSQHLQQYRKRFCEVMDDDFSTPQALAVLFELIHEVHRLLQQENTATEVFADALNLFQQLAGDVLGLLPETESTTHSPELLEQTIKLLLELRRDFRQQKDFARADLIRQRLQELGIELQDSKDGTTWEIS